MPAVIPVVAAVAGSAISGSMAADAAEDAANIQAGAARDATATQERMFNRQIELTEPNRQMGQAAGNRLMYLLGLEPGVSAPSTATGGASGGPSGGSVSGIPGVPQVAPMQSRDEVRARLAPQFTSAPSATGSGYEFVTDNSGQRWAVDLEGNHTRVDETGRGPNGQVVGGSVNESALNAAVDAEMARLAGERQQQATQREAALFAASQGQAPAAQPSAFGSFSRPVSQEDIENDVIPDIGQFTEEAPRYQAFGNSPTFADHQGFAATEQFGNLQAPEQVGQMAASERAAAMAPTQQIAGFGPTARHGEFAASRTAADYVDAPDLSGYEDLPAFTGQDLENEPGYQFRLNQGTRALEGSRAGKGAFFSGATGKALVEHGQGFASNEYDRAFGRHQTNRDNRLASYLTNRDTSQQNRNNRLGAYQTNRDTLSLNEQLRQRDFLTNRDTSQLNEDNRLRDYATNRDTQMRNQDVGLRDYATNRDTLRMNEDLRQRDYTTNRDTSQQNWRNTMDAYGQNRQTFGMNQDNRFRDYATNRDTNQQNIDNRQREFAQAFDRRQVEYGNEQTDYGNRMSRWLMNQQNTRDDAIGAYNRTREHRTDVMNPLFSMMGYGQVATGQQTQAAGNFGNQAASNAIGAGNARAAGAVGGANAWNNAIGQGFNMYQGNRMVQALGGQQGTPPPANPYYGNTDGYRYTAPTYDGAEY